jgi:hypothetical protein
MDQEDMTTRPRPKAIKAEGPMPKDNWDKFDIGVRALIPVLVAGSVYLWNVEKTSRDTAAQMITIATSILTAPPDQSAPSALRQWAIAVLRSPEDPPLLTADAAIALEKETLPFQPWLHLDPEKFKGWTAPSGSAQTPWRSEPETPPTP